MKIELVKIFRLQTNDGKSPAYLRIQSNKKIV